MKTVDQKMEDLEKIWEWLQVNWEISAEKSPGDHSIIVYLLNPEEELTEADKRMYKAWGRLCELIQNRYNDSLKILQVNREESIYKIGIME